MNKKDLAELRRLWKGDDVCADTLAYTHVIDGRMTGVNSCSFLSLEDDVFYKLVEIAKKCLSGNIQDKQLFIPVPETNGALKRTDLETLARMHRTDDNWDASVTSLFERIAEGCTDLNNYAILLFKVFYDVPMKADDNATLDDSDYTYAHMICAICPVELTKPSLMVDAKDNALCPITRLAQVKPPETAFLYPAFTERSSDYDHALVYVKNAKEPSDTCITGLFGASLDEHMTLTQKKIAFEESFRVAFAEDGDLSACLSYLRVQDAFTDALADNENAVFNQHTLDDVNVDSNCVKIWVDSLEKGLSKSLPDGKLLVADFYDEKTLNKNKDRLDMANQILHLSANS